MFLDRQPVRSKRENRIREHTPPALLHAPGLASALYDQYMTYTIAAFYRFVALPDPTALQGELQAAFTEDQLLGTILMATEGINGTVAGSAEVIDQLLALLAKETGLNRTEVKFSTSDDAPFGRLKLKVKPDILAFRKAVVDATKSGTYVEPQHWNALLADPDVLLLDTRNHYEVEAGTFAGAVDPNIETFSDFATYVREHLDPTRHHKVAMFCTGGIRCEKASAFMLQEGFGEVFHLRGGILRYLEEIPAQESTWRGECFVFDRRRGVGHEDFES
jgi:UPF0176 protein